MDCIQVNHSAEVDCILKLTRMQGAQENKYEEAIRYYEPFVKRANEELLEVIVFSFFTLVTGPRRSLSLKLSDTRVMSLKYEPASVTTTDFCRIMSTLP